MMPIPRHFKNQLLLAFLIFSSLLGLVFYIAMDMGIHQTENYLLESYLQRTVDHAAASQKTGLPDQYGITTQLISKAELPAQMAGRTSVIYQQNQDEFIYIRPWRSEAQYLVATLNEKAFSDFEGEESTILGSTLSVAIIIIVLSWFIALGLTHIIAQPLLQLTGVINRTPIDSSTDIESHQPLYGADRNDEIGSLSRAFSTLLQRVRSALKQERSFSHHVSHELRTPLALINNATALIKQQPTSDEPKITNNIKRIENAADRIDSRIRLFLHLGLEQQPEQTVKLETLWQSTVDFIQQQMANPTPFGQQRINDAPLQANPSLVQALFENSLLNAVQHGTAIDVELDAKHYCIRNTILAPTSATQANHFGYGMDIIRRVCEASGWQLKITQTKQQFLLVVTFS